MFQQKYSSLMLADAQIPWFSGERRLLRVFYPLTNQLEEARLPIRRVRTTGSNLERVCTITSMGVASKHPNNGESI